ncbi:DUF4064 domain-containing protein [Planococcus sp. CAU13]|uniref:DUF4064 domain-containing protein n=1 Tax=Planococcus sp. CAU13 TaxID=1541197 RepID=UPI00052FFF1E|nr:DUF4064 domain-containing protein [Planococcus sp. CAU13]
MKRTAEIVLGVIGALGFAFMAAVGAFMLWLQNNRELFETELTTGTGDPTTDFSMEEFEIAMDFLGAGGWVLIASAIVAIVLGIVAMVLLKGNRKPVIAGILFIATAVIVSIVTTGVGILAGLFYLIAGILCLVRKPKTTLEM